MTSPSRSETARFCAGVAAVRVRPAVVALLVVEAISRVAFAAFPVIFIVVVSDELSGDGTDIGLIRGTSAFGGIVAALVIARRASRFPPARLLFAGGLAPATLAEGAKSQRGLRNRDLHVLNNGVAPRADHWQIWAAGHLQRSVLHAPPFVSTCFRRSVATSPG